MWIVALFFILILLPTLALAHDESHHAQMTPEQRDWFGRQLIPEGAPNEGGSCCSQADGEFAEEDIRDGHYWARWPSGGSGWHRVPDEVVIRAANRNGAAAVWFGGSSDNGTIYIRCFVPGAGL